MTLVPVIAASGAALVFAALADALAPAPDLTVSAWAEAHVVLPDETGTPWPGPLRLDRTPYLREPMDHMGVNHPAPKVTIAAGAQSGKTLAELCAVGHAICLHPRPMMMVFPSQPKAVDFEAEKLTPFLDNCEPLRRRIAPVISRSARGSTTRFKRFPGGFLKLASASTAKELQSSSVAILVNEELTDWPEQTDKRGDPLLQARERMSGQGDQSKEISCSTTGSRGSCRITDEFEAGDQRRWYMACPHCGDYSVLRFEAMRCDPPVGGLRPDPYFVQSCCGGLVEKGHLTAMLASGVWIATYPGAAGDNPAPPAVIATEDLDHWRARRSEGRHPSFHWWQAIYPLSRWDKIWADWEACESSPENLVTFHQQTLAEPYEPAMDRPDRDAILALARGEGKSGQTYRRVADYQRGTLPPWAWLLFGAADVQADRIEWAAWAYGPASYGEIRPGVPAYCGALIDWGVIPVNPADPRAWGELASVRSMQFAAPHWSVPAAFDLFGVDTGGLYTQEAYRAVASSHGVMALKGNPQPDAPIFLRGNAAKLRSKEGGQGGKLQPRVPLWLVGGNVAKTLLYHGLSQAIRSAETGRREPGALFLPEAIEDDVPAELTAEFLTTATVNGQLVYRWKRVPGEDNEHLDMANYARALANGFGVDRLSRDDWTARYIAPRAATDAADVLPFDALWSGSDAPAEPAAAPAERPVRNPQTAAAATAATPDWLARLKARNDG